jgi:hypothetical protein
MLGERLDLFERLSVTGSVPVRHQLVPMQLRPFTYESERARRHDAAEDLAVQIDRGAVLCVFRVEVRHGMVALIPIHPITIPKKALIRGIGPG